MILRFYCSYLLLLFPLLFFPRSPKYPQKCIMLLLQILLEWRSVLVMKLDNGKFPDVLRLLLIVLLKTVLLHLYISVISHFSFKCLCICILLIHSRYGA